MPAGAEDADLDVGAWLDAQTDICRGPVAEHAHNAGSMLDLAPAKAHDAGSLLDLGPAKQPARSGPFRFAERIVYTPPP